MKLGSRRAGEQFPPLSREGSDILSSRWGAVLPPGTHRGRFVRTCVLEPSAKLHLLCLSSEQCSGERASDSVLLPGAPRSPPAVWERSCRGVWSVRSWREPAQQEEASQRGEILQKP